MGAKSRRKGRKAEQDVVNLAKSYGLAASRRNWSSAQSPIASERAVDVFIGKTSDEYKGQVKCLASLPKLCYDSIIDVDVAFLRGDGKEWLVVMRAEDWLKLIGEKNANS